MARMYVIHWALLSHCACTATGKPISIERLQGRTLWGSLEWPSAVVDHSHTCPMIQVLGYSLKSKCTLNRSVCKRQHDTIIDSFKLLRVQMAVKGKNV